MKILITGISGRIGANLAQALIQRGHSVRGLVWPQDARREKLAALDVELVEGTITNPADVDRAVAGVEVICHLAAAFQGGGPFTNEQYFEINVRGTFNLLEAARQKAGNLQHFFYASTDAAYEKYIPGGVPEPIREDEFKVAPVGQYALTKTLGEQLSQGYYRTYGLPVTVFRFALAVAGDEILDFAQFYLHHWRKVYEAMSGETAAAVRAELQRLQPQDPGAAQRCLLVDATKRAAPTKSTSPMSPILCRALALRSARRVWPAKPFNWRRPARSPGRRQSPIWPKSWVRLTLTCAWPVTSPLITSST